MGGGDEIDGFQGFEAPLFEGFARRKQSKTPQREPVSFPEMRRETNAEQHSNVYCVKIDVSLST